MPYPRFQRARNVKFARRMSTDVSLGTAWIAVDTALDLVLEAQTGDVIEYGVNALWDSDAVLGAMDVVTIVSSSPVTYFSSGTSTQSGNGAVGWFAAPSSFISVSGSVMLTLVTGDISGGLVRLRLYAHTTSGTRTLFATSTNPLQVFAKNLGPVQPF